MSGWRFFFERESQQPYQQELRAFLNSERAQHEVYPPADRVFYAMQLTPLEKVRAVIIGQDPYHGPGQAMGLCFSVPAGCELPPSLRNIYKEIERDLGVKMGPSGDLTPWAQQGVLLLNAVLTVRRSQPLSHQNRGWELFTDHLVEFLLSQRRPLAFLLWGRSAQDKLKRCLQHAPQGEDLLILQTSHPSPLSAHQGFLGCGHFSKLNGWLQDKQQPAINWQL